MKELFDIYLVDDEQVAREGIALALKKRYQIKTFASGEELVEAVLSSTPDMILLDIGLPGMTGVEVLGKIKEMYPEIIVIMITAYEGIDTVVTAMKKGAYDYIVKPVQIEALLVTVKNALETIRLRKEIQLLHEKVLKENVPGFIGESDAMQDVMETVAKVAKSPDTSILILGETGTGKELIAKAIHYRSPNFEGPLVSVNCAAIPKELVESELFGYEKGAFSGANKYGKEGLVEKAAEGTLFLDEVGDLSLEAQAKLLRFLEEGEFYRVGGTKKRMAQTRVVAATNKNLFRQIEDGQFRQDLYHRLAVIKIEVPSLNERREDIVPIAKNYLFEFSKKFGKNFNGISSEAEAALKFYDWTGNVRELKNVMERAVLINEGPVLTEDALGISFNHDNLQQNTRCLLPEFTAEGIDLPKLMASIEYDYFKKALSLADNNESKASGLVNMSRDAFRYRRNKLRI